MKRLTSVLALVLIFSGFSAGNARETGRAGKVTVGVVLDGPGEKSEDILRLFCEEILDIAGNEFDIRFPDGKTLNGHWTPESVREAFDQLLCDPEVDIVLAPGFIASHGAAHRSGLSKPVIAPLVLDVEMQNPPSSGQGSGVKNLNYIACTARFKRDLDVFHGVVAFRNICILVDRGFHDALPEFDSFAEKTEGKSGASVTIIPVGTDTADALKAVPSGTDAVYVLPLLRLTAEETDALAEDLSERNLPSYSFIGAKEVKRGFLLGMTPEEGMRHLARRAALNLRNILLGSAPESLPVEFPEAGRLTINMETARAVGFHPDWATLTEADLVGEAVPEGTRILSLEGVVKEAMAVNLDLAAKERMVAAGSADVREARSRLLPHMEIGAVGAVIDEDRAELGFGAYPERSIAGTASLTQVIWSEQALANLSVQKSLQAGRTSEREQARLDVVLEAAAAYLNVLRAKTYERIQRNNLETTRTHLELARVRNTVGTSGPSEIYRWEAQTALARKSVIDAEAKRSMAEMALNRVLRRPLEEGFVTAETRLDDPSLLASGGKLFAWLKDPWSFGVFCDFLVREGVSASPKIKRLDAAIGAQERVLRSTESAFFSPTVAFQGQISNYFSKDGAGVSSLTDKLPADFAMLKGLFPKQDDTSWSIGIRASFLLSRGGAKYAERRKAREDLKRLELERAAVAAKIEQRIRSTLRMTGASYAGIQLSRDAAESAGKNLELVRDAYSRGVVSIMEMIDAQNTALMTGEGAANAEFEFLLDLMNTERAAGRFEFFVSVEEQDDFFHRLDVFSGISGK